MTENMMRGDEINEESRSHDCPIGGISLHVLTKEEADLEDKKGQTYTLNCHRCGGSYCAKEAFPVEQICLSCSIPESVKREIAEIIVGKPSKIEAKNGEYIDDPLHGMDLDNAIERVDQILTLIAPLIEQAVKEERAHWATQIEQQVADAYEGGRKEEKIK